jgi:hypothetical protein
MADAPLPPAQAEALGAALHAYFPTGNPYHVPSEQRVDDDALDPDSVANPDGENLDWVDPDAGDIVDIEALERDA